MTNPVIFRRCLSHELSNFLAQDADSLIFIEDWNVIYKTTGKFQPLARYSDVQSGFTDLEDLETRVTLPVNGKLYLTDDSKIYYYADNEWKTITAQVDLSQFDEVLDKIKDDIADLATNVSDIEESLDSLRLSEGKLKNNSSDTSSYLEDKINSDHLAIKYNKLIVKSIDGMTVGTAELNHLSGISENVQVQLNNVTQSINNLAGGLTYIGKFPTETDLHSYANSENGMLAVVLDDGNKNKVLYIYSELTSSWDSVGAFEFSDSLIGLRDTPSTYEDDMYLKSDGSQLVYSKIKYSELQGKPNVAVYKIENAANTAHEHPNLEVLNKFSELDGKLTYNNSEIELESKWEVFEF